MNLLSLVRDLPKELFVSQVLKDAAGSRDRSEILDQKYSHASRILKAIRLILERALRNETTPALVTVLKINSHKTCTTFQLFLTERTGETNMK